MPSCSVHHCVLFLLTLTFTTDPGSAASFPIYAKLHQSVTLPCEHQCSGWAKWSLDSNRDDVFARCDQTSCTSVQQGYEMSHDQFKKGDLSLTITNPDYSMRETYTCECDYSDFATVRLRIFTVSSAVQMSPGEDLKLDLSVPESVEVIYRGSDSADGKQICTVIHRTLQCNTEYTPRTSLSYPELTLRDLTPWESGTYTIRNLDYKEDIRVYAVSVSAVSSAVPVQTEGDLKLDLSVPESVEVIYRGIVSADDVQICTVTHRTLQCNTEYTPRTSLSNSELTLRDVQRSESGTYTIRDMENNRDIRVYTVSVSGYTSGETAGIVIPVLLLMAVLTIAGVMIYRKKADEWKVKHLKEEVKQLIRVGLVKNTPGLLTEANLKWINSDLKTVREKVEEVEVLREEAVKEINDLEEKYSGDRKYSQSIKRFCYEKRRELELRTSTVEKPTQSPESEREQFILELLKVNKAVEKALKALKKARRVINDLEEKYREDETNKQFVTRYCNDKRRDLGLWSDLTTDSVPTLVKSDMEAVNDLIGEAVIKPTVERMEALQQVEKKIKALEQKYKGDRIYSEQVTLFCNNKRSELEGYRKIFGQRLGDVQTAQLEKVNRAVEKVLKALEEARSEIDELEDTYCEDDTNTEYVTWFCNKKREDLRLWKDLNTDSVPKWRVYIFDQDPQSLVPNMETAVRILERLSEASAERRVIPSSELDDMFTCAKECLKIVNSWSSQGGYDMKVVAPQIQQWSEEKMVEWNKYKVELLRTPETQNNADRGERDPLV